MTHMFTRVWEYEVPEAHIDDFIVVYDAAGDWARLFQRGAGFVGTELFRSTDEGGRFVTVDRWEDKASWRAFLENWSAEYEQLDATMLGLAEFQRSLSECSL